MGSTTHTPVVCGSRRGRRSRRSGVQYGSVAPGTQAERDTESKRETGQDDEGGEGRSVSTRGDYSSGGSEVEPSETARGSPLGRDCGYTNGLANTS